MPPLPHSSRRRPRVAVAIVCLIVIVGSITAVRHLPGTDAPHEPVSIGTLPEGSFGFNQSFTVSGRPEEVYDALTGDISGWWDHSRSGHPSRMFIEARPGGGFYEMVGNSGDGIMHARVTYAIRGKQLTLDGPLPFSEHAIEMRTTYTLEPVGDSTRVLLTVHAEGEVRPKWPARIERNWRHFIFERFIPYWNAHHPVKQPKTLTSPVSPPPSTKS